jgi:hypothetical protein
MAGQDIMDETLLDLGEHITGELSGQGERTRSITANST